jgi:hypothetical protein
MARLVGVIIDKSWVLREIAIIQMRGNYMTSQPELQNRFTIQIVYSPQGIHHAT